MYSTLTSRHNSNILAFKLLISNSRKLLSSSTTNLTKYSSNNNSGKISTTTIVNEKSIPMMRRVMMNNGTTTFYNYHTSTVNTNSTSSTSTINKKKENYSNLLLSKLFQVSSKEDRQQTVEQIKKDLFHDTKNQLTYDKLQNILRRLDCLEIEDFNQLLNEFIQTNTILSSMKHQYSHKVLLRLYDGLSDEGKRIMLHNCIFNQNLIEISTGKYSGTTLRELITRMDNNQLEKLVQLFNNELVLELSKDTSGAFLISKLIQTETNKTILKMVEHNFSELIVHPIGNYIVKECIEKMEDAEHYLFILKLKNDFKHIASTQYGSIVIKEFMKRASDRTVESFFNLVVLPNFKSLATSRATPYMDVIFDRIGIEKQYSFVEKLALAIVDVGSTTHGSIFVQKLISKFNEEQLELFLHLVKPKIKDVMEGSSSSFIIPELFNRCNKSCKKEMINALKPHIMEMSINRNSSRVLQHIMKNCDRSEMDSLILPFLSNFDTVISNEASSPIFQMIVQRGFGELVFLRMKGKIETLATSQFGSYVVSDCLKNCKKSITDQILMELLIDVKEQDKISEEKVIKLLRTKSGSFVLLDCLNIVSERKAVKDSLLITIQKHLHLTRNNSLKKKIAEFQSVVEQQQVDDMNK